MKKDIYCPLCLKRGKKKVIGRVDENTEGILYLWCKEDKKEIKVVIDKKTN